MNKRTSPFIFKFYWTLQEYFSLGLFIGAAVFPFFTIKAGKALPLALERCSD